MCIIGSYSIQTVPTIANYGTNKVTNVTKGTIFSNTALSWLPLLLNVLFKGETPAASPEVPVALISYVYVLEIHP